eukprot:gene13073-27590_t
MNSIFISRRLFQYDTIKSLHKVQGLTKNCMSRSFSKTVENETLDNWVIISGFSRFASRQDLSSVIHEIQPEVVDAVLDRGAYPCGKWALKLSDNDKVKLQKIVQDYKQIQLTVSNTTLSQLSLSGTASQYGITPSTVRLRNLPNEISEEELRFFFQDHVLRQNPFMIKNLKGDLTKDFSFIHFESPKEALRAVTQKNYH